MPLVISIILFFTLLVTQSEFAFFFDFFSYDFLFNYITNLSFFVFNNYNFTSCTFSIWDYSGFQKLTHIKLEYDYNYRTYFTHTYLHAAYNKHMKPYRNLFNTERLFGDYNVRTYGKSKKHARAIKHTKLFMLMYSHTLDCYAFNNKLVSNPSVMFYFKKQHIYSTLEMFYASLYLGMIYFLSFTYVRTIEDGSLNNRETEEIDEELAQNHWYYFREDRRGLIEPAIADNEEVNFAYPQHPVEWDDNGHFYRWETHFFIFLFSFLICWGVSQSAASMFFYDNFIDLHFMSWLITFAFIFIFWRIFFIVQFFTFFNRFHVRRFVYLEVFLPIWSFILSNTFKLLHFYLWPFAYAIFSRIVKLSTLNNSGFNIAGLNLIFFSMKTSLKNAVIKFYRYIYSAYQKNLSFFDKRNIYDFILTSNALFIYNSRGRIDGLFYYYGKKDKILSNIFSITTSFIDNYRLHKGLFFPKNMYLTTNKVPFPSSTVIPVPFPFYLDYYNINDLPMWGADFFFNQNQNVFGISESYENWFFTEHYSVRFYRAKKASFNNNYIFLN